MPVNTHTFQRPAAVILGADGEPIRPPADAIHIQSSYQVNAFDPPHINYEPTLAEKLLPKDLASQHKLWRSIYNFDSVAGVAMELYGTLPFGEFSLTGIDDKRVLDIYMDSIENLGLETYLPLMAVEYLTMGKLCCHFTFNATTGLWTDIVTHDPDAIEVTPVPLINATPLVSIKPSPELKQFAKAAMTDKRFAPIRRKIGTKFLQKLLRSEVIPLAETNTLYLARKATMQDFIGTSIYTRILAMVLYERALINGNIEAIHRRIGPIRLLSPNMADERPPELSELQDYINALIQADRDKVSAYLALRRPVSVDTIAPNEFIRFTEDWQIIQESKLQALGMSASLLSGEATVSTLDAALSTFLERVRALRAFFVQKVFVEKLFENLARVHQFNKRTAAELSHRVRTGGPRAETQAKFSDTDQRASNFVLPEIKWANNLRPTMDQEYLQLLETLEGKGVPVTLRTWASAGNLKIDKEITGFDEDLELRKAIQKWSDEKKAIGPAPEEEAGMAFGLEDGPELKEEPEGQQRLSTTDRKNLRRTGQRLAKAADANLLIGAGNEKVLSQ